MTICQYLAHKIRFKSDIPEQQQIGFPVWWEREPSIIDTFMEQYEFSGKAVVPFATSWSSGIGSAGVNMQALAAGARVAAVVTYPKKTVEELTYHFLRQLF